MLINSLKMSNLLELYPEHDQTDQVSTPYIIPVLDSGLSKCDSVTEHST